MLLSTSEPSGIQILGVVINSLQTKKLLGVHFDKKLNSTQTQIKSARKLVES